MKIGPPYDFAAESISSALLENGELCPSVSFFLNNLPCESNTMIPTIDIYSSIECPFAYLATFRLQKLWHEYEGKVHIFWRALALEYINQASFSKPLWDAECNLMAQIEPELPFNSWVQEDWRFPTTFWPAYEALACAQAQGEAATLVYNWRMRYAFFAEGRNISLRHELMAIAEQIAAEGYIHLPRFTMELDTGRYKRTIIAECWDGWRHLRLSGSPSLVMPDDRVFTNPAVGQVEFNERTGELIQYIPFDGDPLDAYRQILVSA